MEEAIQLNVEPVLWVGGVFLSIIVGLLSIIAYNIREDKRHNEESYKLHNAWLMKHDKKFMKHDKKFDKTHNEIKELLLVIKKAGN